MTTYVVECFWPNVTDADTDRATERARLSAEALTLEGIPVRFVRSVLLPSDDVVFFVFDGVSADAVGEASDRAGIRYERILLARERA